MIDAAYKPVSLSTYVGGQGPKWSSAVRTLKAMQWDGTQASASAIDEWVNADCEREEEGQGDLWVELWVEFTSIGEVVTSLHVHQHNMTYEAEPGDWIVQTEEVVLVPEYLMPVLFKVG